jgi:hypothetical protein
MSSKIKKKNFKFLDHLCSSPTVGPFGSSRIRNATIKSTWIRVFKRLSVENGLAQDNKKTFMLCGFFGAIDYGTKTLDIKFD